MTPEEVRSVLLDAATEEEFLALSQGIMLAYKRQTPEESAANHVALLGVVYDSITTMRWYFDGRTPEMKEAIADLDMQAMVDSLVAVGYTDAKGSSFSGPILDNLLAFEALGFLRLPFREASGGGDLHFELIYAEE